VADVVVTGASGFVGSAVVRALLVRPGTGVRAGSRRGGAVAGAPGVRLDVLDAASLHAAMQGADAVVHCAVGDARTTVAGTQAVLDAAAKAGVRRVVHLSSIAVYGAATGRLDELAPMAPPGRGASYAEWKVLAEQACSTAEVAVVRLRPTIIYGPGSALWIESVARRIRSGRWGTFGVAGAGTCNPVHVDDVAQAAAAALDAPGAGGQAFNIDGGTPMTWNDWFSHVAAAIGAPPLPALPPGTLRRRSLASLPFKAAARLLPPVRRALGGLLLAAPAGSEVALFARGATYPADRARAGLGWSPDVPLADGLAASAAWLRDMGLAA